jgi:hypothetical protein
MIQAAPNKYREAIKDAETLLMEEFSEGFSYDEFILATDLSISWILFNSAIGIRTKSGAKTTKKLISNQVGKQPQQAAQIPPIDYGETIQWRTGGSSGTVTVQEIMDYEKTPGIDYVGAETIGRLKETVRNPAVLNSRLNAYKKIANMMGMDMMLVRKRDNAGKPRQTAKPKRPVKRMPLRKPLAPTQRPTGKLRRQPQAQEYDDYGEEDLETWGV